ncbi:MAG: glycosyltransferase family 2 protein [Alphaproteobacteria bacterium]
MTRHGSETQARPIVDVVLATYNGAEFVAAQIDSLLAQTYRSWRLLARDDGSTDGTADILRAYQTRHPERIILVVDDDGKLGYVGNFSRLLSKSTAAYVALCDQDDVWLADKLSLSMAKLHALERARGPATPLLVHTDLRVVDRDLEQIHPSFWRYRGLDPRSGNDLNRVLAQNVATGCATVFNSRLKDLCLPVPPEAAAHDWWIALVAAAFGSTDYVADPTILYRQHRGNTIGAQSFLLRHLLARVVEAYRDLHEFKRRLHGVFTQASVFRDRYADRFTAENMMLLNDFAAFPESSAPRRLLYALKWRIVPPRRFYWLTLALCI